MSPASKDGLHARLRAATARAHRALEDDLGWEARIATLPGYRGLLACLHGFHAGYEPAIGRALADEGFLAPRRRLDRLRADLDALGCDAGALPVATPVALPGPGAALGALYVLEGSTLGGRVIRQALERRHGAAVAGASTYYDGHGRDTAAAWRAFCADLEARCARPEAEAAALAAAVATFDALRLWLADGPGAGRAPATW